MIHTEALSAGAKGLAHAIRGKEIDPSDAEEVLCFASELLAPYFPTPDSLDCYSLTLGMAIGFGTAQVQIEEVLGR